MRTTYGNVFDRNALVDWLQYSQTDPICGEPLTLDLCVPDIEMQTRIYQDQLAALSAQALGVSDQTKIDPKEIEEQINLFQRSDNEKASYNTNNVGYDNDGNMMWQGGNTSIPMIPAQSNNVDNPYATGNENNIEVSNNPYEDSSVNNPYNNGDN